MVKSASETELEKKLWHVMVTGELPQTDLRAASTSIEHAKRVKVLIELVKAEYQRGFSDGQEALMDNGQVNLYTEEDAKKYAIGVAKTHANAVVGDYVIGGEYDVVPMVMNELIKVQRKRNDDWTGENL